MTPHYSKHIARKGWRSDLRVLVSDSWARLVSDLRILVSDSQFLVSDSQFLIRGFLCLMRVFLFLIRRAFSF